MKNKYEGSPQKPDATPAQPELTKEQIDTLLRYLADQQAQQMQQQAQPQAPVIPAQPLEGVPEGVDTGTRILYQSPDFEKKDPAKSPLPPVKEAESLTSVTADAGHFRVDEMEETEVLPPRTVFSADESFEQSDVADVEEEPLPTAPGALQVEDDDEVPEEAPEAKKKNVKKIVRIVVLTVSVIAILASLGVLLREFLLHKNNQTFENEVSNLIITDTGDPNGSVGNNVHLTEEQQWEQLRQEHPNIIFPKNMQLKYAKFYATNTDFVGYLEAPGINLHLPVVQTRNDTDYLYKNFYGDGTKYGCPFVSCQNKIATLDMNTVIYGHHMNDNSIFGALDKYKRLDGFKAAPVITFNTLYADYSWKVIAAFISNAYAEDDNGYIFNYFFPNLSSAENQAAYLNEIAQRSLYNTGVDVRPGDKLLTLSTCSHEFENARFVVVARLIRDGESADVDTSAAVANSNPRYPQAYYTKKKLTNPYANASRWFVG